MSTTAPFHGGGTTFALHLQLDGPVDRIVSLTREAEAAGVDAVYVIEAMREAFVPLAAMAAATSTIRLGTYVANAHARTPQAAATAALNLDDLSGGRFTFGVGAGNWHLNEWFHGVDSRKPMQAMRDYLAILRAFLRDGRPDGPEIGGAVHRMQSRFVRPPARPVPVIVAAAGPRMIELAATESDGVGLGILISAEHLAQRLRPHAAAAAAEAGRDPDELRITTAALVNVHQDEERARTRTRRAICGLFHPVPHPYYDHLLRQQGFADFADRAAELAPQRRWDEAMDAVDDEIIDRLTITGTPERCAARLGEYVGLADEVICLCPGLGAGEPAGGTGLDEVLRMLALATATRTSAEPGRDVPG